MIEKLFTCRFLFEIFDFLLYTSLGDLYILNPPKCCFVGLHLFNESHSIYVDNTKVLGYATVDT